MPRTKSFDATTHLTNALAAIDADLASLQKKRAQLAAIIGNAVVVKSKVKVAAVTEAKPKRKMSAAARKKISEAQKKRWAEQKGGK